MIRPLLIVLLILGTWACEGSGADPIDPTADMSQEPDAVEPSPDSGLGADAWVQDVGVEPMADAATPVDLDAAAVPDVAPPIPRCELPGQPIRRLSNAQFGHTLTDLITISIGETGEREHFWWTLNSELPNVPADVPVGAPNEPRGGFRRLDQVVYDEHVEIFGQIAAAFAWELSQPWWAGRLTDGCRIGRDEGCVESMIEIFGQRVHRRPLLDEDVAFYLSVYETARDDAGEPPEDDVDWWPHRVGLRALFATLLTAPRFLYHVELGGALIDEPNGVFELDAWEKANRLSYHFWQSMPDDELLAAAADGRLDSPEGYAEQVERLYQDPKAFRSTDVFYTEWLRLDEVPDPARLAGTRTFDAFAGEGTVDRDMHEGLIAEIIALGRHFTHTSPGSFTDLLTSRLNFAAHEGLARIYQTEPWDGGAPRMLPQAERAGLLTRGALLVSGSANTRPIIKGVRIREAILCETVPPPPPNVMVSEPDLSDGMTSREVVEALTEQPGTVCASCHVAYINPLGFMTENFDAIGRLRAEQILFDDQGTETGRLPVMTETTPQVVIGDDTVAQNAAEVTALILASGRAQACFAKLYFRFTFGRPEHRSDATVINDLTARLQANEPLDQIFKSVALRPEFSQRRTCVDGE